MNLYVLIPMEKRISNINRDKLPRESKVRDMISIQKNTISVDELKTGIRR